ncbi:MAG: RidA family protein [Eubacteriales bacterium]|jgi:enamine deaminase RidA (YjgF/YER057c/UK114 family)
MDVYERLKGLKIELTPIPPAAGAYLSAVPFGEKLLYLSGAGPTQHDGKFDYIGKVGRDMDEATAYQAARSVGITQLSILHAVTGDLNRVKKIVKVLGFVNCTEDFGRQPAVINGFSELMTQVFGSAVGAHARSAIGVNALPGGIPVEVELLVELK